MILLHYDVLTIVLLTIASVQAFSISNKSDATSRSKIRKFDLTQSSANFYRINDAIDGPNVNNIKTYFSALEDTQPNLVSYLLDQDEIQGSQKKAETNADETADNRLPTSVVPDRYVVTLIPNLDDGNFTFVGAVEITLNVTNATNSITVHANDLEIDDESVSVRRLTDEVDLVVLGLSPDTGRHFFTVTVAESLVVGQQYRLRINYTGHLREDMGGFYRSYYYVGAEKRWLASTQFQSTSARRAFPCFDEPAFKAKFKISIARTEDRHALSNMPVASSVYDQNLNLTWDHFEETPMPMSSYLVAFVVSDFVSLNASDGMFRTWQRASALSQANYSIEISPDVLKALENFTGVEYFLPKLDQVAVPDFSAGAMENWGIVTYREQNILFEYGVSTSANKQRIAEVIAHELAHKWFGNLVSPKWWNYLWLSEGFATYFQYFAMHKVDPNMRLDHQFLFLHHHTAFQTDSLESSHPMTNSPTGSSVTQIVYNKAGSVIRMMEHILTTEIFRKGLNRYLTERYNNIAEADDLFSALNAQYIEDTPTPQIDVKIVMDTWTLQKGYPVLTVNRNYTTGSAIVSQKRFLLRNNEAEADTSNSRWWVPLTFTSQANQDFLSTAPKIWMNDSQTDTTIADIGARANQWVIFNIQETGFYRVNYDAQNWAFLAGYLNSENFTNIHVLNRAQLLDDALNLARAGVLSYRTALETTKYLSRETDYIPWYAALTGLSYLDKRIRGLGQYEHLAFRNYILELLSDLQKTIGFEEQTSDDHTMKLLRNLVLTWSCDYGNRDCISWSIDTFAEAMSEGNTSSIPPDVKTVVYCNALRQGGEAEWDFLWEQYLTSEVSTEQALILGVLGCTTNETVAHKYLRKTITEDSYIRAQDNSRIYPSVYNNPYGVDFAISFLANNYKEILEFNNNAVSSITNLVSGIASAISSQDQLEKLRSFFTSISEDLGESGLATAEANLQSALRNLAWLEENGGVISTWVKEQDYRLPRDIVPDYYVVKLTSDLDGDTFTYDGSVDITLNVSVDTSQIILHANDLEMINTIVRKVVDEESIVITATNLDTLRDFYYIQLEENLVAGEQYILSIVFQGHHREDMYGFYRSYYYNETGDKSWIASTQFQATSARRAFPCFDEPGFKARFKISIARTEDRHARSNMPLLTSDEINDAGLIWDHFQETPMPISTYLIAFVVSDFVNLSSSDGFYSTWQRAGAVYQAQYSIDVSPLIMKSLENFTELDYFLPKMDQVAVPDFSAGAMENWGLVTYRERNILLVEDVTPSNYKQAIAAVIAHEFAHKWFGNLVSPVWWKHLWLNEGFARYFQYFTTADVEPTWRVDDQFLVAQLHTSILADSLETAHSLTVDVGSPSVVSSIFGTITYNKGASVIRMMEHFLGHETFRKGLSKYLGRHGNKTAEPDDLFAALHEQHLEDLESETRATEALPVPMKTIMDTWTLQSGHPVLTVTRDYTTGTATVSQERFLLRRSESTPETSPRTWWIPLSYTSLASIDFSTTTARKWLSDEETQSTTGDLNATSNDWVIFNIQQTGFYRVNYDARNWALLANYLNSDSFTNIHVLNRAQLLDDAFNLARAGVLNYGTALSLTKYLARETDYIPWFSALTGFTYLDRRIRGLSEYDHHTFKNYILGLLNHTNEVLGLTEDESDGHVTKLNRNLILTWQCNYGVSSCTDMSINEFNKLMDDPDNYKVAPDLKTVVYCNALRYGGEEEWNFLWNRYLTHNVNTEQVLILGVLGCTRNETLAHRHLRKTITSDSGIRLQDIATIYPSVHNNPYGVDFAINFLSQNFREIIQFNASVPGVVSGIAGAISSQEQLDKLEQFINDNAEELGSSTTTSALNNLQTAKINLEWLNTYGSTIMSWIKQQNYRLPTHIVPYHYNVVLKPNLDDDTFQFIGRVEISFNVTETTDRVQLHADDLEIDEDTIAVEALTLWGEFDNHTVTQDSLRHIYDIKFSDSFRVGHRYRLHLNYKGYHREDMAGFYRSYYYKNGVKRWLASTQFQPTSARRAFPCFDEPGLKATFKVSIGVDSGRHALANMPVESIDMNEEPGIAWHHFQETPMPISTYLIAFVVSDFSNLSSSDGFYSTWQREAAVEQAQYSIEVTPRLLRALEAYTGQEYFLPKLDQIAVPDFDAGAMENWGLITYREIYILYQERVSRAMDKQNVATIIAHELAHKWFGNLVSPKWWKYLWLNEGFATFFEYFATASVETSWRLDHQFVPNAVQSALSSDSLQSSHPMTVDVGSPNEISSIFSTVSYSKAGSVIRMIEHCLTPEIFRKGISQYVTTHGNQTAEPDYLFRALQEQYENEVESPEFDVKTVLDTWSTQKGYPVITVTRDYSQGQTTVQQERFLRNMSESPTDTHDYKWWVPLTYTTQSQLDFNTTAAKTWLEASQDSSLVNVSTASNEWILFNIQETGFYRVNYDAQNWALLANYLNSDSFTNIHVLNRAQLLDDAFNLARAGSLDYGTAFTLTKYLARETDYIPWYSALTGFNYINRRIRGMSEYDHHTFKKYILKLFEHVQDSLGYDELEIDSHTTKINRNLIMSWLCNYEVKSCTDYATREFAALMNNPDSYYISPNLKSVVYCNGLRFGGEEEWDFLWNRYLNHNVNTEQVIILGVLGCTKNETLAHRYLRKTITANSSIRSQDQYRIYSSVNNNHYGIEHSISFLEENYREIYEFNNNSTSSIVSVISGISGSISSQEEVDRLKQFISDVVAQEFGANVATSALNSLRTAENNLLWLNTYGSTIMTWIKQQDYRLPTGIVPDNYYVVLKPNLDGDTFQFEGRVDILINVTENTDRITLHADDLDIDDETIHIQGGTEVSVVTVTRDTIRHFYDLKLNQELLAGRSYRILLFYKGYHREDMAGFYRSYYYKNGEKRWLASSQFQPTSARRAFPCFDEPGLKAKFRVTIGRTNDTHSLSNMPVQSTTIDELEPNIEWDNFQETPMPISTYLIAFIVSDFVNLSSSDGFYSTWQRSDAISQAQYSIDVSPLIMKSLENFTELDYFLPKMDQVAVPDFSAGAMENWGLVTYREQYILHEEGVSTSISKQGVATIIAHEFAHKWFGNLVSPTWWRYTWLNEGFARYFQFFTTHTVETTWRMEDQFVVRQVHTSLSSDSLESAHALSSDVGSPSSVSSIFSTITYNKGASVIRMMEHFMTHETFRKGLSSYLSTHGNRTAEPDDLFAILDSQYLQDFPNRPVSVKTVMDTWTLQSGHPVITITRNYISGALTVTQERFYLRRSGDSTDTHDYKWWVPLTYTSNTNRDFLSTTTRTWMNSASSQITINNLGASANDWVIFNIQQTGFYRVNYDAQNWALLTNYLNSDSFTNIHVLNRAQLLDDAFNLARAGSLGYTTALEITKYLSRETDYIPWFSALTGFTYLDRRFRGYGEYNYTVFKSYLVGLLSTTYQTLSLEEGADDDHTTKLNRNLILTWLCNYGVEDCTNMAKSEFNKLLLDSDYRVTPDLKTVVYCNALRYGGEEEWNFLWNRYLTHNVNTEQVLILGVLGCTRNETLAHGYLRKTITSDSGIRSQDIYSVYPSVYNNVYGVDFAINFLSQNFRDIIEFNASVSSVVSGIAGAISSQEQLDKLEQFINDNAEELGSGTTTSALNNLQTAKRNLEWLNTYGSTIMTWIKQQNYRLPTHIVPYHYNVVLQPNLDDDTFQFTGSVEISFNVTETTDRVQLHANDLEIDEDTIAIEALTVWDSLDNFTTTEDSLRHIYDIKLSDYLIAGRQYKLHLNYKGYHREDMAGFYRSYYYRNGVKRWLASTHFQATNARRAFPCFDEPALKAQFKISIARTEDRHALSNMPVETTEQDNVTGLWWDHFQETPMPMSTYLVAFVVSDFVNLTSDDGKYSTWQRSDAVDQAQYSIDVSPPIMAALENFTELDYFLPKVDQVAIPDFSAGAMENWGLVTYRERNILFVEGVTPSNYKQTTLQVIAHEFAHKWFGNLVSPDWWSYLWLNEGFARYFQYFTPAEVEPDWRLKEQFVVAQVQTAMSVDSLASTHAMSADVGSPTEIRTLFSSISYNKAAAVIRMTEHFITHDNFREGLVNYLKDRGNHSATPDHLFESLNVNNEGLSVKTVLDTWSLQEGYPIITVIRNYDVNNLFRTASVHQERFYLRRSERTSNTQEYRWWVPLTYTFQSERNFNSTITRDWLRVSQESSLITDIGANATEWLIFNIQEIGFYRVNYDYTNWNLIISHLNSDQFTDIHLLNRAQLLDDSLNLARAGILDYNTALNLTLYLTRETDYIPWYTALSSFTFLDRTLRGLGDTEHSYFKDYVLELMESVRQSFGLTEDPSDDHVTKLHRNQILTRQCNYGVQSCIDMATSEFTNLMNNPDNYLVDPDLKTVVYCNALRYGGEEEWNFLWNRYLTHNVNTEQVLILGALGCTRNETLAHGYLAKTINSDSGIRTQDLSTVSSSVYNNPYGVDFAISFLSQNYRQMIYFNNSTSTVTSLISNIAGMLSTQAQLNELRSFITNNSAELGTSVTATALNSLQTAQNNLDWLAEHGTTITNWLKSRRYRLPTDILPDRYVIELIPYIDNDNFTFNGRVEIFLDVAVATNAIRLHANDLDINATSVTVDPVVADGTIVKPTIQSQVYSEDLQIYTIILSDNLVVGEQYKLSISFLGHLRSDMQGFYRSYYDVEGERRWLASTQFQATHARRAFPCFDEPGFKSKFKISIARTEDRHALSNMPVESSIPDPALGLTWDHFEETPMPMSSYLVAFVVSDFVALNRTLEDTGVVYRNWQRAAAINQSMYSIDISPRIMTYLDNFTGIPYFLPKVDQVAVPDFSAGAMENWGLVTYRERNILHEVGVASAENKQRTADIISHEFAHKWFGNLVSPKWWGHLWLNEGFARYFQYFATAQVETDWRYGEQFVVRQVHQALSSDSLESSHPMTHEVSTPSEAWGMFSTISYAKGASVIRMAEHFLGSTAFQNGLQEYLSNHGNQTTEPDYLFNVLQSHATGIDVKAILDTWTLQKNYPVITVTRNYGTGGVTVRQERFLLRRSGVLDNHVYRWYVPLTYTTQTQLDFNTTSTKQWLPDFSTQATIGETVSANQWILFNIQQTGFYRVDYDARNWALLTNYLNSDSFTNIHVLNRAQLLDDAFNLARAEILDYTTALEITKYLSRETDYIPWYSALSSLSYLNNRLRGASEYDYYVFKNYLKVLLGRVYTEVGLEVQTADGHVAKLLRNSISTWACDLGDQTCIDFSRRELAAYMADPENYLVDPDVKSVVFCNGLRYGGEEEWNFLWGQYLKSEVSTEQVLILGILGCTNTESLAHRYLNLTITEDAGIRTQDIALVAPSVYNNPAGVDFAINYLFSHYQDIANYNGGSYSSVISLISGIGGALSSQNQYQRLRDFIEEADLGASAWNALATAERNLLWLETNGPSIAAWLRSQNYRLPETIVPDTYSVKLIPYLEGDVFTFDGEVLILVNVTTTTNRITLHVNDLEIEDSNVSVRPLDSADNLTLGVITRDEPRHFLDISVPAGLTAGQQYEVNIQYQGYMRDDMFGFYRSYYYVRGEKRWLGTTQFQPTHARRAFPSFDEPSFKAKFKMSIARPANYHALFNTRKIEQEIPEQTEDGRIWDHFEETPYMSTYLIAFVVSDFDNVTNAAGNVTIWQREEASPQASYALSISQPTVTAMERLIGHDYQLPKLDKVAIPDFSAGAMENWGIVTYRERLILWDEIVSTTSNKQTIATIVAHEIAHKWFGNLVTLQWWKYAWLNEGFATYFETFATALVEPDWRLEEQFVLMDHQSALSSDALETSRPMMYDVDTPSEIWSVFDFVNYAKAGTVIRMMEHFLTRDTFLKGLHTYLANHGYSNSEPDNLFAALQEQLLLDSPDADLNVKTVMDTWINQMGYPVVTVTRNYSSASASVSQERFLIQRNPDSTDSHDYKWWIPLSYTRKTGAQFNVTTPSRWLQANESQIVIENIADSSDWIIFNLQESAYYRVNYDANNWNSLISQLNSEDYTVIPPVNRAQLLDDSLNLARAGILDYATALSVTSYLSKESDYIPWASAFTAFSLLDRRLKGAADEDYQLFKNYVLNLIGDLYNTLGFDEKPTDHHLDKFLRSNVLTWACNLGLEDCINRSKEELAKQMSNASYNILADVSSTVYCNALRHGGHNEWNHLWARYMSSNVGTEQVLLLNVLGCSNNEHIINSYLSLSITPDSGIRSQDASSVFVAVYSNPAGVDLAFNFLRDNYQSISEFYGGMGSIGNILTGIAARLSTREQADALREFVEENQNNLGTALGASRRALETVEENLVWLGQNGEDIFNWLREVSPTTSSTESTNTTSTGTTSTGTTSTGTTSTTTTSTSTTTEPTVTEPTAPDTTTQGDGANSFTGSFCIILFSLLLTYTRFV